MVMLGEAVMIGGASLCVGGAVRSRRPLSIVAALIMLAAMCDLVWFGLLPAVVWALLLVFGGVALGVAMRTQRDAGCGSVAMSGDPGAMSEVQRVRMLQRAVALTSALAYVAMAWLALGHGHGAASENALGSELAPPPAHAGHAGHGGASASELLVSGGILLLVVALCILLVLAVRRRRTALAVESGGMAAMMLAMLAPTLLG